MKRRLQILVCTVVVGMSSFVMSCPTCVAPMDATTPALFSKEYEKEYERHEDGTLAIQTKEHAHVPEQTHTS